MCSHKLPLLLPTLVLALALVACGRETTATPISDRPDLVPITAGNAAQIQEIETLPETYPWITDLAMNPQQTLLAISTQTNGTAIWDLATHAPLSGSRLRAAEDVRFSPDGKALILSGISNVVHILDTSTGDSIHTFEVHFPINDIALTSDGSRLVAGMGHMYNSRRGYIRQWDLVTGEKVLEAALDETVTNVAISPGDTMIASGNQTGNINLWTSDLEQLAEFKALNGAVAILAFNPTGNLLAISGTDPAIHLWDVANRQEVLALAGHTMQVGQIAFSPDGSLLASVGQDGTLRLWDVATGQPLAAFALGTGSGLSSEWITAVIFSPDGKLLATGGRDGIVRFWGVPVSQ